MEVDGEKLMLSAVMFFLGITMLMVIYELPGDGLALACMGLFMIFAACLFFAAGVNIAANASEKKRD